MRYRVAFAVVSVAILIFMLAPSSTMGQGKGKKGGGFGGGGFGGPGGGFGGPRGGGDPNSAFDFLAKGRPYFLVTESPRLSNSLGQFLLAKGINSGQVTRELFAEYNVQMSANMGGQGGFGPGGFGGGGFGQGGFGGQGGFPGQGPGGFGRGQGGNPVDMLNQLAESDFNLRDRNGDGQLNMDEMPADLKADLSKWDTNRDNLISLDEYKVYYVTARMQNRRGQGNQAINPVTIIIEDEIDLDLKPVMLRAGKLQNAKELPSWFMELDTDKDGQVALYEWHKAGKDLDEFTEWDRNNDGYITPEEAIYKQRQIMLASASSKSEDGDSPVPPMMRGNRTSNMSPGAEGSGGGGFGGGKKGGKGGGKKGGKGGGKGSFPGQGPD